MQINKINELVKEGYISVQKHPSKDLFIYNYTPKAQYENFWPEETQICRGLILDSQNKIVARPFRKFFNYDQHGGELPAGDFVVYDKLDGSLGIVYFIDDKPYIATRGSFTSDQAIKANEILNSKYDKYLKSLDKKYTYLFEIIYPQNRIVVNYGKEEKLVLLAIIETQTGIEKDIKNFDWPEKAKVFDGLDIVKIKSIEDNQNEGFVLKWENGFRLKFKFEEYKRLHKILTNVSAKTIWEYLKDKKDFKELLEKVPDEFFDWLEKTKNKLQKDFDDIEKEVNQNFEQVKNLPDRKTQAQYIQKNFPKQAGLIFGLLDQKDISQNIWKIVKPKHEKPFKNDES